MGMIPPPFAQTDGIVSFSVARRRPVWSYPDEPKRAYGHHGRREDDMGSTHTVETQAPGAVDDAAIDLMRHALGVASYIKRGGRRFSKPYRNHFVAGGYHEPAWNELVRVGLAEKTSDGSDMTGGCASYRVTDEGQRVALAGITFKARWGYAAVAS